MRSPYMPPPPVPGPSRPSRTRSVEIAPSTSRIPISSSSHARGVAEDENSTRSQKQCIQSAPGSLSVIAPQSTNILSLSDSDVPLRRMSSLPTSFSRIPSLTRSPSLNIRRLASPFNQVTASPARPSENPSSTVPVPAPTHAQPQTSSTPPAIHLADFYISPGPDCVLSHPLIPLSSFGLVINTHYGVIICLAMGCCCAVEPSVLYTHVHHHYPRSIFTQQHVDRLQHDYKLVSLKDIAYPKTVQAPVFGLAIKSNLYYICGDCYRGYQTLTSLKNHQSARCGGPMRPHHQSYVQCFTEGQYRRYFPIDVNKLQSLDDAPQLALQAYTRNVPPLPDYAQIPISSPSNGMSLDTFAQQEGWLRFLENNTPEAITEASRMPASNDGDITRIVKASHHYLDAVQSMIQSSSHWGIRRLLATVRPK